MLVCGDRARRRAAAIDVVRRRAARTSHLHWSSALSNAPEGNLAKLAVCKTLAICFSARGTRQLRASQAPG